MRTIEYRVENKYLISDYELTVIAHRLKGLMEYDSHQQEGRYEIRSVYFDDIFDACLDENDAGVDSRRKYRIRSYGPDFSLIRLEIKEKESGFTRKRSCKISAEEYELLLTGANELGFGDRGALNEFVFQSRCRGLRPKTLIKYERTAFVYPSGNVRITFDRNITASRGYDDFFKRHVGGLVPVLPAGMHVLEVKYDELLPDAIAQLLETGKLQKTAFSKYYLGRLAVNGNSVY